jgi:phenylpyruvate tautomerase PptA (4-oxalocrotonate tautomerase family)
MNGGMPLQRIDMVEGRSEQQRRAIADAVHRALVDTIGVPQDDRFQIVTEHPRAGFLCTPAYLGIRYENPILIQLTVSAGRTTEQKQALYRRIVELLEAAHVPRNDAIINLVEVARDDWSFGDGVAQYVPDGERKK